MELAVAGESHSFEVTYDSPALIVALTVFDDSGPSPIQAAQTVMQNVYGNTYRAKFTPADGKSYIINKAVYTDETLGTIDDNYAQGSESIKGVTFSGGGTVTTIAISELEGTVEDADSLDGSVADGDEVSGAIEDDELTGYVDSDEVTGQVEDGGEVDGEL